MKKAINIEIVTCLFIVLFLYTGISKIIDQDTFRMALGKSTLLSPFLDVLAIGIPALEIAIAACLLAGLMKENYRLRQIGLIASTMLMAMFSVYVVYMLVYVKELPCSCGGIIQKMTWHQHAYFNCTLTLLGLISLFMNRSMYRLQGEAVVTR